VARLRNNIIANFGGQIWSIVMGVAFVPIYIRILGIEAYGLIGFFLSLQGFFLILDMGLSSTLNRELARYTHFGADAEQQRDLVRTLEWLYWPTGLLIAFGVLFFSGPIANNWLNPVMLGPDRTAHAIALMGLAAALQWPCGLYAGGLRGLERQVALNGMNALFATLRSGGAAAVIAFGSPTIEAFLWWQVAVGALHTLTSSLLLWKMLPVGTGLPRFRAGLLHELSGFALGMTGTVALSFLLMQSDRIILAKLLPLNEFGYYVVAATVAAALPSVIQPFFGALYPRFSGLVAAGDKPRLIALYHQGNQLLAVTVAAVGSTLAFFSVDVLRLWTHDAQLADKSGPILSLLVIGSALNALMYLPYALQLAHGWTRLAALQNLVAVFIIVPMIWLLGRQFGGIGAAMAWFTLNLGYVCIGVPLMHRVILPGEMQDWYLKDVLPPVVAAVLTGLLMRQVLDSVPDGTVGVALLAFLGINMLFVCGMASPAGRAMVRNRLESRTT
jgi:O-antigen/teichoic acid export membrane protein